MREGCSSENGTPWRCWGSIGGGLEVTTREKSGVAVLVGLFILLAALLVATFRGPSGPVGTLEDNAIVNQTVINHTKSR